MYRFIFGICLTFVTFSLIGHEDTFAEKIVKEFLLKVKNTNYLKEKNQITQIDYITTNELIILNKVLQKYEIPDSKEWEYLDLGSMDGYQMQLINLTFFNKKDANLQLEFCSIEFLFNASDNTIENYILRYQFYFDKTKLKKLNFEPIESPSSE